MIVEFSFKYPLVAEYAMGLHTKKYSIELQWSMVVGVSVVMAKLHRGDYNHFLKNKKEKIPDELIDGIGIEYLRYYSMVADQIYIIFGRYTSIPTEINKISKIKPDEFIKHAICKYGDTKMEEKS